MIRVMEDVGNFKKMDYSVWVNHTKMEGDQLSIANQPFT